VDRKEGAAAKAGCGLHRLLSEESASRKSLTRCERAMLASRLRLGVGFVNTELKLQDSSRFPLED